MDQTNRMRRIPSPATIHHQSRWIRGFSRVGLVLACIVAIGVLGIGAFISIDASYPRDYEYNKRACLLAENGNRRLEGAEFKAAVAFSVVFLICWLLGWIFAGFAKS